MSIFNPQSWTDAAVNSLINKGVIPADLAERAKVELTELTTDLVTQITTSIAIDEKQGEAWVESMLVKYGPTVEARLEAMLLRLIKRQMSITIS